MDKRYEKLLKCRDYVRTRTDFVPEAALVLGSGLGGFAAELEVVCEIGYAEIPGFPVSTVAGHAGKFIFGRLDGVNVACMQGRVHFYEGYDISDVVLPARLMKLLGAKVLFLTNASGGVNREFNAGDLMLINRPHRRLRAEPAYRAEHRRARRALPGYVAHIRPGALRYHPLRREGEQHTPARGRLLPADRPEL